MIFKNTIVLVTFFLFQISLTAQHPELIPYKKGETWGYANYEGEIIIEPQFDKVTFFRKYYATVWNNNKMGLVAANGEIVISTKYQKIHTLNENLFKIKKDGKYGLAAKNDKIILHPFYQKIYSVKENYYKIEKDNKLGIIQIINNKSKTIIPCSYDRIRDYIKDDGTSIFICSKKGEPKLYYDANGKFLHSEKSNNKNSTGIEEEMWVEAIAEAPPPPPSSRNTKRKRKSSYPYQLINEGGKEGMIIKKDTIPAIYDYIDPKYDFSDAYTVKKDGKWGIINPKGEIFLAIEYDSIDINKVSFQNVWGREYRQIFFVQNDGLWGVIGNKNPLRKANGENEILIPLAYDSINKCVNNKWFILEKDGLLGVAINGDFSVSIPPKYKTIKRTYNVIGKHFIYTVTNENGVEFYVGQNGVEYYSE